MDLSCQFRPNDSSAEMIGWKVLTIALVDRLATLRAVVFVRSMVVSARHQIFTFSTMYLARTSFNRLATMVTDAIG